MTGLQPRMLACVRPVVRLDGRAVLARQHLVNERSQCIEVVEVAYLPRRDVFDATVHPVAPRTVIARNADDESLVRGVQRAFAPTMAGNRISHGAVYDEAGSGCLEGNLQFSSNAALLRESLAAGLAAEL